MSQESAISSNRHHEADASSTNRRVDVGRTRMERGRKVHAQQTTARRPIFHRPRDGKTITPHSFEFLITERRRILVRSQQIPTS